MAISETLKKQFTEYILLQAYDDQYIDRNEEKKILEVAIKNGISIEEGLFLLHQLAFEKAWVIEREVESHITEILEQFCSNDGVIDKKEFEHSLALFKSACKGKRTELELKRRLKEIILEHGWRVKEGGLWRSKWFSEIN